MQRVATVIMFVMLLSVGLSAAAQACGRVPSRLLGGAQQIVAVLERTPQRLLKAMDAYVVGMEACYNGALGVLELAPLAAAAEDLTARLAAVRMQAEDKVRGKEIAHEAFLSSDLWEHLNALRVGAAYAAGWGQLSMAVRRIAAEDRRQQLMVAARRFQELGLEFKYPIVVQRAIYAQAVTHVENGDIDAARNALERLKQSLQRGGAADFRRAVDDFYAEITAPEFVPPMPPSGEERQNTVTATLSTEAGNKALTAARAALKQNRPAAEILALLKPAMQAGPDAVRVALGLMARDPSLLRQADFAPMPALAAMRESFARGDYAAVRAGWSAVKPYADFLPRPLKRQVNYQMGASLLNLGEPQTALVHLQAARAGLGNNAPRGQGGAQAARLDGLIVLARLSVDIAVGEAPDTALIALAEQYKAFPAKQEDGTVDPLARLTAQRARIVLARHAAAAGDWAQADRLLTGFGPQSKVYKLFTGMRVRIVAHSLKSSDLDKSTHGPRARGGLALYQLWRFSKCPSGCIAGNVLAVHRAALELVLVGGLASTRFGEVWGAFVAAGGDIRPHVPQALDYLLARRDAARLLALLEPSEAGLAAFVLSHWKEKLDKLLKRGVTPPYRDFLAKELAGLQGRPRAILLEMLTREALANNRPQQALAHADELAAAFPRRPSAWFLRAAALRGGKRHLEAARALSTLARRTPPDDPVGMGARLGLAALFIDLDRRQQACAMRAKIFSRPTAKQNWRQAEKAFDELKNWHRQTRKACTTG